MYGMYGVERNSMQDIGNELVWVEISEICYVRQVESEIKHELSSHRWTCTSIRTLQEKKVIRTTDTSIGMKQGYTL